MEININLKVSLSNETIDVIKGLTGSVAKAEATTTQSSAPMKAMKNADNPTADEPDESQKLSDQKPETKAVSTGKAKTEKATAAKAVTLEYLQGEVAKKALENRNGVKSLLTKHGADKVSALDESKYSEFMEDLKNI